MRYHGRGRKDVISEIGNVDIVLTTYHTLVADEKRSPLYDVVWYRVVLDEGQYSVALTLDKLRYVLNMTLKAI